MGKSNGEVLERWRRSGEVLEKLWRNDGEEVLETWWRSAGQVLEGCIASTRTSVAILALAFCQKPIMATVSAQRRCRLDGLWVGSSTDHGNSGGVGIRIMRLAIL